MANYPGNEQVHDILPPDYETLLSWWRAWPEARPELVDFWARGNFTRRFLSRRQQEKPTWVVKVEYIDDIEASLRQLALLGVNVDFIWTGEMSPPGMVITPQSIDYEDSGGWGYLAAAGDEIEDRRGDLEWCPSMGWASLFPTTVTDWMAEKGVEFIRDGSIFVAPSELVGMGKSPIAQPDEKYLEIGNSPAVIRDVALIKALAELELPRLDGLPIADVKKFLQDEQDSFVLFQSSLRKLLQDTDADSSESIKMELIQAIREGVAEVCLSDRTLKARKSLTVLGAAITTFCVTVGLNAGLSPGVAAIASGSGAMATLALWHQLLDAEGKLRQHPFYIAWALQGGKSKRMKKHPEKLKLQGQITGKKQADIPPYHWLAPPTPGWGIPTAFVPR